MTLFYSGDKSGRHINGVGFLVSELLLQHVKHFELVSDRICYMCIADKSGDLILICVYAPTEIGSNDEKEVFYEELERTYDKLPNHCTKICLGDFNAQVGNETMYKPTVGGESAHDISNGNRMRLIEYAIAKDLIITSTFFLRKLIYKLTWTAPNNVYKSHIDHVLINSNHRSSISNIRSHRGADGDSDHFLVLICYKKSVTRKQKSNNKYTSRYNIDKLCDIATIEQYQKGISEQLNQYSLNLDENVDDAWEQIKNSILNVADETIQHQRKDKEKPWFNQKCEDIIKKRNQARLKMLQFPTQGNFEVYELKKKEATKIIRQQKKKQPKRTK